MVSKIILGTFNYLILTQKELLYWFLQITVTKTVFEDGQQRRGINDKAMGMSYHNYRSRTMANTHVGWFKTQDAPGTAEKAKEVAGGGTYYSRCGHE